MTSKKTVPLNNVLPLKIADSAKGIRHVFIRDYVTEAYIGAYSHETEGKQKIRLNIDMSVTETQEGHSDELANVVCYDQVISGIRKLLNAGHINLVETLAERIADLVLQDRRISSARVRVEKLEAVDDVASVGVEIERHSGSE
ncbi:MAG: dihydroneopterin aldolase [Alphaproteobacteria bacterium]|nr:MAG: dihydroneopterin aldolase [Alphaproteobacteria bacterium]